MTSAKLIHQYLESLPQGAAFPASALREYGSTDNIRQILSRLVKLGKLERVARGVFAKPKYNSKKEAVLPSAVEVAQILTQSLGETVVVHGAEAARQLHLSTQAPMKPVFYTSGNTRKLKVLNRSIELRHVNPSRLIAPGKTSGLIISALSYLGKENVSLETLKMVRGRVKKSEFFETVALTKKMPAWLSDVFYQYQKRYPNDK
jgi:hypothetical protein